MSIENKKTIEVYKEKASTYLKTTIEHDNLDPEKAKRKREKLECFIKNVLENIPEKSKVLEIGSADGTNAKYIETLGYEVTASDIAEVFINEIKNKGVKTIKFNILEDDFIEKYSVIFAWRVFVHFTEKDIEKALKRAYDALEEKGFFIFNVINQETRNTVEEWVDFPNEYRMDAERYYRYFTETELNEIIKKARYEIHHFHKEGGENSDKWLVYVLRKI